MCTFLIVYAYPSTSNFGAPCLLVVSVRVGMFTKADIETIKRI